MRTVQAVIRLKSADPLVPSLEEWAHSRKDNVAEIEIDNPQELDSQRKSLMKKFDKARHQVVIMCLEFGDAKLRATWDEALDWLKNTVPELAPTPA